MVRSSIFLRVAVARSSSGSVAIRYVLPVLLMTSCLHVVAISDREKRCIKIKPARREASWPYYGAGFTSRCARITILC